ncbi:MAG TPA: hypothetical protein VGV90_04760 [Solirubrobacteraceae bacterium]|nr:hypothetical protein [Solirubrobacteraceae bacterium]
MGLLDDAIREHLELKRRRGADAGDISREESEALGPVRRWPDGAPDLSDTFVPGEPAAEPSPAALPSDTDQTSVLGVTPAAHDLPPADTIYEPPAAPPSEPPTAASYEPTTSSPVFERPSPPAHDPPPAAYEPPSPPPPSRPAEPERQWFERAHQEPEPARFEPEATPEPESEAEHPSLLSRFRVGRKPKQAPAPPPAAEPPSSFAPPPLPGSREAAPAYEPPPPPPPSPAYSYDPPAVHHEADIVPADDEPDVEDVLEETPDFLEETPEHDRLWFEQRPPRDFDFDD